MVNHLGCVDILSNNYFSEEKESIQRKKMLFDLLQVTGQLTKRDIYRVYTIVPTNKKHFTLR